MIRLENVLQAIPEEYNLFKAEIKSPTIQKIYSEFIFKYLIFDTQKKINIRTLLLDFLNEYKLITYQVNSEFSNDVKLSMIQSKPQNDINQNSPVKSQNIIICVEKLCLILENANIDIILKILNQTKSSLINVSTNTGNLTKIEKEANDEITSFYDNFKNDIKPNKFVNYTIRPVISYLIRRYFYSSHFFKDQSFFNTEKFFNSSDSKIFKLNKFLILRPISTSQQNLISLAIDIENLGIFMMKLVSHLNLQCHEIAFCRNYSHRCFSHYYGLVEDENGKIVGFIYDFMANGSLLKLFNEKKSYFFSFLVLIRVFQGISYLHSKSLIYRDLHPSNILFNHDNLSFISDFETIKKIDSQIPEPMTQNIGVDHFTSPEQYKCQKYTLSTDIYSFGVLIYYLFERKKMDFDYESIPEMTTFSEDIKNLYSKCVKINPKERPSLDEIRTTLYEHITSKENLEYYFPKESTLPVDEKELNSYFNEILMFLSSEHLQKYNKMFPDFSCFLCHLGKINFTAKDNSKALKLYELSAALNNIEAYDLLGNLYNKNKDYLKAKEYLEIAAKNDNADALFTLGYLYYSGHGVKQDYVKARELYEKAAKKNCGFALNGLGNLYAIGLGVEKDYKKAMDYYNLAAQQNIPNSLINLGNIYRNGELVAQDLKKAKYYYQRAADLGNTTALMHLGNMYYGNDYGEKNYKKALEYYKLAADQGNPEGMNMVGFLYSNGQGLNKDYKIAIEYYKQATKHNFPNAFNNLGNLYYNGLGTPKDFSKAKELFESSAKMKNARGYFLLGTLYLHGDGVKKNLSKAIELFEKAAKKEFSKAYIILADLYYYGQGIEYDYQKAREYYENAYKYKTPNSSFMLGRIYYYGQGIQRNYQKAIEYFQLDNERNSNALFYLGYMHENGKGVDTDYDKAIDYYLQCTKILKEKSKIEYNQGYCLDIRNNENKYFSMNNLGLIYLLGKNDFANAIKLIEEASNAEYPFSQCNFGFIKQFILDEIVDAIYLYERASKNEFALAEYNLGYCYEKEGKIKDSIAHYLKALQFENIQLKFHDKIIDDEQLEISKSFIISLIYLKLIHLQQQDENDAKESFINALFRPLFLLLFQSNHKSYSFQFKVLKNRGKRYITNIKDLILNCPLFQIQALKSDASGWKEIENHISTENTITSSLFVKIEINESIIENENKKSNKPTKRGTTAFKNAKTSKDFECKDDKTSKDFECKDDKTSKDFECKDDKTSKDFECKDDKIIKDFECKDDIISKDYDHLDDKIDKKQDCKNDGNFSFNYSFLQSQVDYIFGNLNEDRKYQLIENYYDNETIKLIRFKSKDDDIERYLQFPKCLEELLLQDVNEIRKITNEIIQKMNEILYMQPYHILLGRIRMITNETLSNQTINNFNEEITCDDQLDLK